LPKSTTKASKDRVRNIRDAARHCRRYPRLVRRPVIHRRVEPRRRRDLAFASTSSYRARECYAGIAEFSVYVARDGARRGAGTVAMRALIDAARRAGYWKLRVAHLHREHGQPEADEPWASARSASTKSTRNWTAVARRRHRGAADSRENVT
jgi:GNAT superfamily N-acetyltransferase